jgi:hypothetical protein
MGNPSVASAELGEAIRRLMVEDCLAVVEKVLSGELRAEEVRSITSFLVVLHPLFVRRLALATAAMAAVLIMLWGRRRQRA